MMFSIEKSAEKREKSVRQQASVAPRHGGTTQDALQHRRLKPVLCASKVL
jgi:hypothetical protein